jgi:uncharacterized protein YndB with AHSA1/START domain
MPQPPVFEISRSFPAPAKRVYEAWVDPTQMVQWSGPKGASAEIIRGTPGVGETTITCMASPGGPEMFSLCLRRELSPHSKVAWEQSFCTREGDKCAPPFFDTWPRTLLTDVTLEARGQDTHLTLKWIPLEYTEADLAMFQAQMASMTAGWTGSFDKLEAWLAG